MGQREFDRWNGTGRHGASAGVGLWLEMNDEKANLTAFSFFSSITGMCHANS